MPTYKPNVRTSRSASLNIQNKSRKKILAVVGVLVALAGGFIIYSSFASNQEIGTAKFEQQGPLWINRAATETTTKQTRTMKATNGWLAPGEKISEGGKPLIGKLSGAAALDGVKNARLLTGKNTDGPAKAKLGNYSEALICANAGTKKSTPNQNIDNGGTVSISVQAAGSSTTIARFNLPKGNDRIFCGTYKNINAINDITFTYEPKSGTTMRVTDISVRPIIQPVATTK